jgi:hypothetical protein
MTITASQIGALGARATNSKLSPAQRSKNAKKAARARWKNHKKV